MKKNSNFIDSLLVAIHGILFVFKTERNFKIHIIMSLIVFFMSLLFKLNPIEFCIILIMICIVLTLEIINTVIENIMDYLDKNYNEDIKRIKDISAGAVLISAIIAFVVGLIIFVPKIFFLL